MTTRHKIFQGILQFEIAVKFIEAGKLHQESEADLDMACAVFQQLKVKEKLMNSVENGSADTQDKPLILSHQCQIVQQYFWSEFFPYLSQVLGDGHNVSNRSG